MSNTHAKIHITTTSETLQVELYGKGADITDALVRATHSSDAFAMTVIAAAAVILRADISGELSDYFDKCRDIIR